jgi:D-amino-acid dehydrogenase
VDGRASEFADSRPVIGRAPGRPGLWLGHGHSGLTLGPVTGRLLADMNDRRDAVLRPGAVPGGAVRG